MDLVIILRYEKEVIWFLFHLILLPCEKRKNTKMRLLPLDLFHHPYPSTHPLFSSLLISLSYIPSPLHEMYCKFPFSIHILTRWDSFSSRTHKCECRMGSHAFQTSVQEKICLLWDPQFLVREPTVPQNIFILFPFVTNWDGKTDHGEGA